MKSPHVPEEPEAATAPDKIPEPKTQKTDLSRFASEPCLDRCGVASEPLGASMRQQPEKRSQCQSASWRSIARSSTEPCRRWDISAVHSQRMKRIIRTFTSLNFPTEEGETPENRGCCEVSLLTDLNVMTQILSGEAHGELTCHVAVLSIHLMRYLAAVAAGTTSDTLEIIPRFFFWFPLALACDIVLQLREVKHGFEFHP